MKRLVFCLGVCLFFAGCASTGNPSMQLAESNIEEDKKVDENIDEKKVTEEEKPKARRCSKVQNTGSRLGSRRC